MPRNELRTDRLHWIDLVSPTKAEFRSLSKQLGLHPHDAKAAASATQTHAFGRYKDYAFLKLAGPDLTAVCLFLTPEHIITVSDHPRPQISALRLDVEKMTSGLQFTCELLRRLTVALMPVVERLSDDVAVYEQVGLRSFSDPAPLQQRAHELRTAADGNERVLEQLAAALRSFPEADSLRSALNMIAHQRAKLGQLTTSIERLAALRRDLKASKLDTVVRNFSMVALSVFTMSLGALLLPNPAFRETLFRGPWSFATLLGLAGLGAGLAKLWLKRRPLSE